jgi:hypothetical protein
VQPQHRVDRGYATPGAGFVTNVPIAFGLRDQEVNLCHPTFPGSHRELSHVDFFRQQGPGILLQSNEIRIARGGDGKPLDGIVDARRVRQIVPDPSRVLLVTELSSGR